MKVRLEPEGVQYRGISVVSETEEEKQILENIWIQKGRPVMFNRMTDGQVQLVMAPTSADVEDWITKAIKRLGFGVEYGARH